MYKSKSGRYKEVNYRKKKLIFWIGLCSIFLLLAFLFFVLPILKADTKREIIRAGICGEVNRPAIYSLTKGADLAMLVRLARGLKPGADISHINLERMIMHDTIYHIPARGKAVRGLPLQEAMEQTLSAPFTNIMSAITAEPGQKEIRQYTILYVGLPSVYILITYYPDLKQIHFTHIPHNTLFLNNDYRLMDIFFTLGIKPTVKMLENRLKQRIDYYLIQDRFAFIDLIDKLEGINLKPDDFHTREFIRFLHIKNMLNAIRTAFARMDAEEKIKVISSFTTFVETDMDSGFLLKLYKDVLNVPAFTFGALPGYYSSESNKLYFYPDIPGYEMMLKKEIRTNLNLDLN